MVDTNSDPRVIDYVIPSNDDASKSIDKIMTSVSNAVIEGLAERKAGKEEKDETPKAVAAEPTPEPTVKKARRKKVVAVKASKEEE